MGADAGPSVQPWADARWVARAEAWIAAAMERLGRPVTAPVEEVRRTRCRPGGRRAPLQPPVDLHMAQSTAWWLRRVLAGLGPAGS